MATTDSQALRRLARETALQVLYQLDVQPDLPVEAALTRFYVHFSDDAALASAPAALPAAAVSSPGLPVIPVGPIAAEVKSYADRLVRGVMEHVAEIDGRIVQASKNWRLERMARVDRNLLRLAVYEASHAGDVPAKVAINEAIEIAKRYGAHESPAFVNGILDRVLAGRG